MADQTNQSQKAEIRDDPTHDWQACTITPHEAAAEGSEEYVVQGGYETSLGQVELKIDEAVRSFQVIGNPRVSGGRLIVSVINVKDDDE